MSTSIVAALDQRVALSIYVILKLLYVGNQGSHDIKLQVTKATMFSVSVVMSVCYNSNFGLSEDESSCDEGEEVHAYRKPRVITTEKLAALSRAVTSQSIYSCSHSASVDSICQCSCLF